MDRSAQRGGREVAGAAGREVGLGSHLGDKVDLDLQVNDEEHSLMAARNMEGARWARAPWRYFYLPRPVHIQNVGVVVETVRLRPAHSTLGLIKRTEHWA